MLHCTALYSEIEREASLKNKCVERIYLSNQLTISNLCLHLFTVFFSFVLLFTYFSPLFSHSSLLFHSFLTPIPPLFHSFFYYSLGSFIPDITAYLLSDTVRILRINVNSPEASNVSIGLLTE